MKKARILITCPKGISPYLKEEILRLEFPVKSDSVSWVETEGLIEDTMRLNLFLEQATGSSITSRIFMHLIPKNFTLKSRRYNGRIIFMRMDMCA